jgi:GAF domain-containing protein
MLSAAIPLDESTRLAALHRYCVLDTPAEPAFDRLTRVAAHVMQVPTVLVSLIDQDRQWFKSRIGLAAEQTPRDISFCGHAVYLRETLLVPNARLDPRFAENPLVTGDLGLRFYLGVPLITAEGHALGTLCVIDYVPRAAPPHWCSPCAVSLGDPTCLSNATAVQTARPKPRCGSSPHLPRRNWAGCANARVWQG